MKFVIEHLSKSFEKKEVLRDIDFTFDLPLSISILSEDVFTGAKAQYLYVLLLFC